MTATMKRIQILDDIEKDTYNMYVITCLQCAGKQGCTAFSIIYVCIYLFIYAIKSIIILHHCAVSAQALLELDKEKSGQEQAETNTSQFVRTLSQVDQINYLTQMSTGLPHEGSVYASSQKVLQVVWHRFPVETTACTEWQQFSLLMKIVQQIIIGHFTFIHSLL